MKRTILFASLVGLSMLSSAVSFADGGCEQNIRAEVICPGAQVELLSRDAYGRLERTRSIGMVSRFYYDQYSQTVSALVMFSQGPNNGSTFPVSINSLVPTIPQYARPMRHQPPAFIAPVGRRYNPIQPGAGYRPRYGGGTVVVPGTVPPAWPTGRRPGGHPGGHR